MSYCQIILIRRLQRRNRGPRNQRTQSSSTSDVVPEEIRILKRNARDKEGVGKGPEPRIGDLEFRSKRFGRELDTNRHPAVIKGQEGKQEAIQGFQSTFHGKHKIGSEDRPDAEAKQSGPQSQVKPETRSELKSDTTSEAKPEGKGDGKPVTEPTMEPALETNTKPVAKTEVKPAIKAEVNPDVESSTEAVTKSGFKNDSQLQVKPMAITEVKMTAKSETTSEINGRIEVESKIKKKIEIKIVPKCETKSDSEIELKHGLNCEKIGDKPKKSSVVTNKPYSGKWQHLKHPLQNEWNLWYFHPPKKSEDWSQGQHKCIGFNTIEDFWA